MSIFIKNIQTCRLTVFIVSFGAPKHNILEKNISDGPSANLRPLFNSNVTKVSVIMWTQNWTRTLRNFLSKDILFLGAFPIVIPISNSISNLDHEGFELSSWNFFVADQCTKRHNKNSQPTCLDVFDKNWHALTWHVTHDMQQMIWGELSLKMSAPQFLWFWIDSVLKILSLNEKMNELITKLNNEWQRCG